MAEPDPKADATHDARVDVTAPESFERIFAALDLDSATLARPVDQTFVPPRGSAADPSIASLPRLLGGAELDGGVELELGGVLGEGGRGEIRLATQRSLRRQVAVKLLKGAPGAQQTQELLREARVTGGLEHPNIVPVHALGRDAQDRVLLVLRRLRGEPWGKLVRDAGPLRSDAAIERHLEIFRQVCHAVEYAHSEGIVHRDLKPDNVVVGAFGEVVVLDWGLALSLRGDATRELPSAASYRGLAGTPSYMAPELVTGDGARVGPWTDVYLLGATLHELFTGSAPHRGGPVFEVLARAYKSLPPAYPPEVPAEIAAICQRAMAARPDARFASVAELRAAVQDFLRHRQSAALAQEARRRLDGVAGAELDLAAAEISDVQAALGQARFGFEQALRTWPENPVARDGLRRAQQIEVELELGQGNLAGAERALGAITSPQPRLLDRVDELRRDLDASRAELARIRVRERSLDPGADARQHARVLAGLGLAIALLPTLDLLAGTPFAAIVAWLVGAGAVAIMRRYVGRSALARRAVMAAYLASLGYCGAAFVSGPASGLELLGLALALVAVLHDKRVMIAAAIVAVGGLVATLEPSHAPVIAAVAGPLGVAVNVLVWRRLRAPDPA